MMKICIYQQKSPEINPIVFKQSELYCASYTKDNEIISKVKDSDWKTPTKQKNPKSRTSKIEDSEIKDSEYRRFQNQKTLKLETQKLNTPKSKILKIKDFENQRLVDGKLKTPKLMSLK